MLGKFPSGKDVSEAGSKVQKKNSKKNVMKGSIYKLGDSPKDDIQHPRKQVNEGKKAHKKLAKENEAASKAKSKRRPKKGKPSEYPARAKKSEPAGTRVRGVRPKASVDPHDVCPHRTIFPIHKRDSTKGRLGTHHNVYCHSDEPARHNGDRGRDRLERQRCRG